eukprot:CAMPEP_0168566678 /NCGR_PEP_ID=MMETSP0413-20121227/14553_1 /TAXON_ID=136452 /ORGANISM="Filamoeba nolandi, Strain NC-AS-23-1" /LENGTH=222 /DNA_ID=CAMNT_0008598725 /DNA_START=101 /DNA_END=769 /DNA_ORIENTATION=+
MSGLYKSRISFLINQTEEHQCECTHFPKHEQQHKSTQNISPPSSPPHSPVGSPPLSPLPSVEKECCDSLLSLKSPEQPVHTPSSSTSRKTIKSAPNRPTPYSTPSSFVNWSLEKLRAETYYKALKVMESDPQENFQCVFFGSCDKKIKGKGNLRRHIEWHLKKIEEESRNKTNVMMPSEYQKFKEQGQMKQKELLELQKQRTEHRQFLHHQLHMQLQTLQTV